MIFYGENEHDAATEQFTFKIIGGEEVLEEDQE
jgi:hypothetical protein